MVPMTLTLYTLCCCEGWWRLLTTEWQQHPLPRCNKKSEEVKTAATLRHFFQLLSIFIFYSVHCFWATLKHSSLLTARDHRPSEHPYLDLGLPLPLRRWRSAASRWWLSSSVSGRSAVGWSRSLCGTTPRQTDASAGWGRKGGEDMRNVHILNTANQHDHTKASGTMAMKNTNFWLAGRCLYHGSRYI